MQDLKDKNGYDPCKHDIKVTAASLKSYGVRNENIYRHNNDATSNSMNQTYKELKKTFKKNPDKNYAVIHVYAGHGMIVGGKQVVLLNEFNKTTRFYKWCGVE